MEDTLVSDLCTPVFIVDLQKVKQNAQAMLERFQQMGVQLRPHMKTHKTVECGEIMTGGSRRCIAVSTLAEAAFYAEHGFDDILYAYPLPLDKVERCVQLSEELVLFHVLIDSRVALQQLRTRPLKAGVPHSEPEALFLAQDIFQSEGVELTGIYVHCGNTYSCSGEEHIKAIAQKTTTFILHFMERMKAAGMDGPKSSIGSTPSCSHPVQDMAQLSEVHPGNYVFYDAQQMKIGSCKLEQVAVRVLTRVIGHYPSRNQLLVDCGWAALSHDGGGCLPTGYAIIEGHPNLRNMDGLNQSHKKFPIGAMLCLIPYHACATAMMHALFFIHSEGKVVDKWTPTRGW